MRRENKKGGGGEEVSKNRPPLPQLKKNWPKIELQICYSVIGPFFEELADDRVAIWPRNNIFYRPIRNSGSLGGKPSRPGGGILGCPVHLLHT